MSPSQQVNLIAVRRQARRPSPRAFVQQNLLHWVAGLGVVGLGTGLAGLVFGYSWLLLAIVLAGAAAVWATWSVLSVAFLVQSGTSHLERKTRGWIAAMVVMGVLGAIVFPPWWASLVAAAVGVGLFPLLRAVSARIDRNKLVSMGLPPELGPLLQELPAHMPSEVEYILDLALRDWAHLRDLLSLAGDSALRSYVDVAALRGDAQTALMHMVRRAPLVGKLYQIAKERGEEQGYRVAETSVKRLKAVGDSLHDAVAAASQYAASEQREEAQALKARVEGLRLLAESLDVDVIEARDGTGESERLAEEAPRTRTVPPTRARVAEDAPAPATGTRLAEDAQAEDAAATGTRLAPATGTRLADAPATGTRLAEDAESEAEADAEADAEAEERERKRLGAE